MPLYISGVNWMGSASLSDNISDIHDDGDGRGKEVWVSSWNVFFSIVIHICISTKTWMIRLCDCTYNLPLGAILHFVMLLWLIQDLRLFHHGQYGLRNKIPACWVENIQIFFCSRQRMSRGVDAARLRMGLSFRTRSLNPQKPSVGGCEPLGILCERAYCIHLPHHSFPQSLSPPLFASFHLQVGLVQPTACMY